MGKNTYVASVHSDRLTSFRSRGLDEFAYHTAIKTGKVAAKVHDKLDPSKENSFGVNIRESRDSAVHEKSQAIAVMLDVTGSQRKVPRILVDELTNLMTTIVKNGYVENPHVLFGAIGDAYSDKVPLQVGQFEGGADEMDDALTNIYLEGNGGSQKTESYELAMYYLARHTSMDCLEKRGKKGYLFITGDELPYRVVNAKQVNEIIGDGLQEDISTTQIIEELQQKFEVFWIMLGGTSYFNVPEINDGLRDLFGQNFIKLEDPKGICALIARLIGELEGFDVNKINQDLLEVGNEGVLAQVNKSLSDFKVNVVRVGDVEGDLELSNGPEVLRLQ